MSKFRFLASVAAVTLATASFAGYWEIQGPVIVGGWTGSGNGYASVGSGKAIWGFSTTASATKFVPNAGTSAGVSAVFKWHIIYHGETLESTDALLSVYGHLYTFADCGNHGTGDTISHAEGHATSSFLGIEESSASSSTSGSAMHDYDGTLTDHNYSSIAFDDAGGTSIPLTDNEGDIIVPVIGMATGSAYYTGTGVLAASGGGDVYGEIEIVNIGGESVESISGDDTNLEQEWVAGILKERLAPVSEIASSMLIDPWINQRNAVSPKIS